VALTLLSAEAVDIEFSPPVPGSDGASPYQKDLDSLVRRSSV
jgi:hypothetical protein